MTPPQTLDLDDETALADRVRVEVALLSREVLRDVHGRAGLRSSWHHQAVAVTSSPAVAPRLMTLIDVSDCAGVSVRTVLRAIQRGELVATRIGRSTRVAVDDVRAWLASKRDLRPLYRARPR